MSKGCETLVEVYGGVQAHCDREVVPGFDVCWRHADVEKMAAKIVDLTEQVGTLQKEQEDAAALANSYQTDLIAAVQARADARALAERYQVERGEALARLAELERYKDTWRKAWEAKDAVLQAETKRRIAAEEALVDLQRSIASALFGAARDDERVPISRINGAMIDALDTPGHLIRTDGREVLEHAEAFLAEESARGE